MQNGITLFIMTSKGYEVLKTIVANFNVGVIDKVISSSDKSIKSDYYEEIKNLCLTSNIPFYDRQSNFQCITEYSIAVSWRWLIKGDSKLIVLHDSILPKYRGFAPLVNSLINGEKEIGVTALFASNEYDKGNIIFQEKLSIGYPLKIEAAIKLTENLYSSLAVKIIESIIKEINLPSEVQDESLATYSLWLNESDYKINWHANSSDINRFIDSVGFPYQGASSVAENKTLRILDSEQFNDVNIENRKPGKIIFLQEGVPIVVCGTGLIKLTDIRNDDGESLLPFKKFRTLFQ